MDLTASRRKRVAILYGGRSVEHEISIMTALEAAEATDPILFEVVLVYVDLRGRWWTGSALRDRSFYPSFNESEIGQADVSAMCFIPVPDRGLSYVKQPRFFSISTWLGARGRTASAEIDVYMPLFHGTFGEDGCVQGMLELADVPYTGCGVTAAAIGMKKSLCKRLAGAVGLPVLDSYLITRASLSPTDFPTLVATIAGSIGPFPYFVKPANLGSSVAVGVAKNEAELLATVIEALKYDEEVIVEPLVANLFELNVAVRSTPNGPEASKVEMPHSTGVLTYDSKYRSGGGKSKTCGSGMASMPRQIDPELVPSELKEFARRSAVAVYSLLGCRGVARIDFLVDASTRTIFFNEINTLPGSLANYLFAASVPKVNYTDLLSAMIDEAIDIHRSRRTRKRDFGFRALRPG